MKNYSVEIIPCKTLFLFIFIGLFSALNAAVAQTVKLGLEVLASSHAEMVRGKKIALLAGPGSLDMDYRHSIDRLSKAATVVTVFTGDVYFRETIPGDEPGVKFDALTNSRVIEVVNPLERPHTNDLKGVEVLVIDVQDIGIRFFNYVTLLAQFLDLARETGIPVIVLDRPNPINASTVSGPILSVNLRSRFGVYPIPLIYGMTFGELALYFNKTFGLEADLTVVGMEGYSRAGTFRDTGLYWPLPSAHLPYPESPSYYAMTGFLGEMGVFSTGVGTTRPFQYILAPWIDGEMLAQKLSRHRLPGVRFIPASLKPFYGLFRQRQVGGIEIIVTDSGRVDHFLSGLAILRALWELYPDKVPLQNRSVAEALDTLLGDPRIRDAVISGLPLMKIYDLILPGLNDFRQKRKDFLIYH